MYGKILVPVDLEEDGSWEQSASLAAELAAAKGAEVHLLNIIHAAPVVVAQFLPGGYEQRVAGKVESDLDKLAIDMGLDPDKVTTRVRFGSVYQEILAYADKAAIDLIVIGSHRPGVADYLLGSNASRVVRHAICSVLVVRSAQP